VRITLGSQTQYAKYFVGTSYARLAELQQQVASGKRVSKPSDDPVAAGRSLSCSQQISDIGQYLRNAAIAKDFMSVTSSTLDEVYSQVQSAISDAQSSLNSTVSDAARRALVARLDSSLEQLQALANATHLGRYIFSGHRTDAPPLAHLHTLDAGGAFTTQAAAGTLTINGVDVAVMAGDTPAALIARINASTQSHGVTAADNGAGGIQLAQASAQAANVIRVSASGGYTLADVFGGTPAETVSESFVYGGDRGSIRMQVSPSLVRDVNMTGDRVFNLGGAAAPGEPDLFQVLTDLKDAISTANIPRTEQQLALLQSASGRLLAGRVELGGRIKNMEGVVSHLEQTSDDLKELRSNTEDADITQVVVNLKAQEQVYQAALFSASSLYQMSLLDYLR